MLTIPKKTWLDSRVEIKESAVAGQGSFAKAPIKKGEIVIIWGGGVVVTEKEFEEGFKKGLYQPETAIHFDRMHMWAELVNASDPNDAFINHSCDPNLWFSDGWPLTARRDIQAGEELTFDYATGETYPLKGECQCGSINCRHHMSGEEWKDVTFQQKYKGHFNPYIQGLIDENIL
jgi:SET domain-containing protein